MAQEIILKLGLQTGDSSKTLNELKQEILDIKKELGDTSIGSAAFGNLTEKLKGANKELSDVNKSFKNVDTQLKAIKPQDLIKGFSALGQSIAGGFTLATGALGLFGKESKAVAAAEKEAQSAIALAVGVATTAHAVHNAVKLLSIGQSKLLTISTNLETAANERGTIARLAAAAAQKVLAVAMAITPFGAVLLAITGIVTALAVFTSNTNDAAEAQEKMNANLEAGRKIQETYIKEFDKLRAHSTDQVQRDIALLESQKNKQLEINKAKEEEVRIELINLKGRQKGLIDAQDKLDIQEKINDAENKLVVIANERSNFLDEEHNKRLDQLKELSDKVKEAQSKAKQETDINSISKQYELERQLAINLSEEKNRLAGNTIISQEQLRKSLLDINSHYDQLETELKIKALDEQAKQAKEKADADAKKQNEENIRNGLTGVDAFAAANKVKLALDEEYNSKKDQLRTDDAKKQAEVNEQDVIAHNEYIKKLIQQEDELNIAKANLRIQDIENQIASGGDSIALQEQLTEARKAALIAQSQAELDTAQGNADKLILIHDKLISDQKKIDIAAGKDKVQREKNNFNATADSAQKLSGALQALAKKDSQTGRALALFDIELNTSKAISEAVAAGAGKSFPANLAAIISGIAAVIGGIAQAKNVLAGAQEPSFAEGGYVSGPGTGNSDSINARLSNGEFIVNSNSTAQFLPLLQLLNGINTSTPNINQNVSPAINNQNITFAPIRAYVVESDITESQKSISRIKNQSTF